MESTRIQIALLKAAEDLGWENPIASLSAAGWTALNNPTALSESERLALRNDFREACKFCASLVYSDREKDIDSTGSVRLDQEWAEMGGNLP